MLIIVHNSLARHEREAWEEGRRDWLYLDQDGLLHQGGSGVSVHDWRVMLAERLIKSTRAGVTINRLALIVPNLQSAEVQTIINYILGLSRDDYWVDVGIVSACDLQTEDGVAAETECVKALMSAGQCGRLQSIWMIGRTTSLKEPIDAALRASAIDYLLQILSQGGEECAFQIGIFPEGDGERLPCSLSSWGFQSFMPGPREVDLLMGAEYRSCVASGIALQSQVNDTLPELMKLKADGFLSAGLELDLAFDGQEDGDAKPWRETLPVPPEPPLRTWQCRILSTGDEMAWLAKGLLRQHEPVICQYYQKLVTFLEKQSRNIRLKGQDRLALISQDARLFVLEERKLHRLSVALRHFFPAFHRSSKMSLPETPCPNEHDPSQTVVVNKIIHSVIISSAKKCKDELITSQARSHFMIGLGIAAIGSAISFWRLHGDVRTLIPVVVALLIVVIADAVNRRRFNRIKAAVNAEIEREQALLKAEFARKLEWVLDKTGLTVRTQVVADMTALENVIRRKVDFLCGVGSFGQPETIDKTTSGQLQSPPTLNLPPAVREQIRDTINDAGNQIMSLADGVGEVEWDRVLEHAKRQIATLIEPPAPGHFDPLDERLAQCCGVEIPPFLCQYDGVFNQKSFSKLFLLPRNIPQSWIDSIHTEANRGDQKVSVYRDDFKGASVLVRYNNLRTDQLLLCFGFPQNQKGPG